jgi:hypothetical protein
MKKLLALALTLLSLEGCVVRPMRMYPVGGIYIGRSSYRRVPNYHRSRTYWSPVPVKPVKPLKPRNR